MLDKLYARGVMHVLSSILLVFLLFYVYSEVFIAPYLGFDFEPSTGEIQFIFRNTAEADLQIGDRIRQVNEVTYEAYYAELRKKLFPDVLEAGDVLTIHVLRGDEEQMVAWVTPGYNLQEFVTRLFGFMMLGLFFWLAGVGAILFVRPKDDRWLLLIAFYFVTSIWIVVGISSKWELFHSAVIMRMALWIAVPIYLHLHWVFPQPIRKLPWSVWGILYLVSLVMAGLQWIELLPHSLAYTAYALALLVSTVLLGLHYIWEPHNRRRIRSLTFLSVLGLVPTALLATLSAVGTVPRLSSGGLPFLALIPAAYFYAAYRRHFSDHSLRSNRTISLTIYLVLVALLGTGILAVTLNMAHFPGADIVVASSFLVITAVVSIWFFPVFQRIVERYLLDIPLAPERIAHVYAARITRSLDTASLTLLIQDEILASLLIHQSALLIRKGKEWQILYAQNVPDAALLTTLGSLTILEEKAGVYLNPLPGVAEDQGYAWVRLALPLKFNEERVGWWLFGHRDPDDFYSPADIAVLELLANQTAIAILNIEQSEQLRRFYEANIDRTEEERQDLANTIHDEILRHLAILNKSVSAEILPAEFKEAYTQIDSSLRRMTSRLRPVMLEVSLYSALEEMADELEERMDDQTIIHFAIPEPDFLPAYPSKVQEYIFRIVQNASENALRYAQASTITLFGELLPHRIEVYVKDDGVGFDINGSINFANLLAQKRFGVVSMYERATIIGAELQIQSQRDRGTTVCLTWIDPGHPLHREERRFQQRSV